MKRLSSIAFALTALSLGTVQQASAADMPLKAAPLLAIAQTWTGCYVGLQAGVKRARNKDDYGANGLLIAPGTAASANYNFTGLEAGPTIGCNYQMANWVVGVEADWGWSTGTGQAIETAFPAFSVRTREHWLGTVRGRLGYVIAPNWMIYGTGGAAFTSVSFANFSAATFTDQRQTLSGWTAGFGAEYMIAPRWSIKGEALYLDYGRKTFLSATNPVSVAEYRLKLTEWTARLGINYKIW